MNLGTDDKGRREGTHLRGEVTIEMSFQQRDAILAPHFEFDGRAWLMLK
jgi:hypothetical protein